MIKQPNGKSVLQLSKQNLHEENFVSEGLRVRRFLLHCDIDATAKALSPLGRSAATLIHPAFNNLVELLLTLVVDETEWLRTNMSYEQEE